MVNPRSNNARMNLVFYFEDNCSPVVVLSETDVDALVATVARDKTASPV